MSFWSVLYNFYWGYLFLAHNYVIWARSDSLKETKQWCAVDCYWVGSDSLMLYSSYLYDNKHNTTKQRIKTVHFFGKILGNAETRTIFFIDQSILILYINICKWLLPTVSEIHLEHFSIHLSMLFEGEFFKLFLP